jgi:hypothetical protein
MGFYCFWGKDREPLSLQDARNVSHLTLADWDRERAKVVGCGSIDIPQAR